MYTRLNLLPWREELRKEQDRQLLSIAVFAWVLMGLVVGYGWLHMTGRIDTQQGRNNFLRQQIAVLDRQIKEIKDIKTKRAALVARMNVIYKLQADRTRLVYLMDSLVKTLPEGVYYKTLTKKGRNLTLSGTAQSNARVSTLMRNFEASPWFRSPDLKVINVTGTASGRLSNFNMTVQQGSGTAKDIKTPGINQAKPAGGTDTKAAAPVKANAAKKPAKNGGST